MLTPGAIWQGLPWASIRSPCWACHRKTSTIFSLAWQVMKGTLKLMRAMTLQKTGLNEVSELDSINFGASELEGFNVNLNVILKVRRVCVCVFGGGGRN